VDRYKLALLSLTVVLIPLFYVSMWLGVAACILIYSLIARLANKDLDRQNRIHLTTRRREPKRLAVRLQCPSGPRRRMSVMGGSGHSSF
jgi:hypothetical protein